MLSIAESATRLSVVIIATLYVQKHWQLPWEIRLRLPRSPNSTPSAVSVTIAKATPSQIVMAAVATSAFSTGSKISMVVLIYDTKRMRRVK